MPDYLQQLTHLNTHKNRNHWSDQTMFQAPHKPFLLLAVVDLAVQGDITSPFVEPSFELIERFNHYWDLLLPPDRKRNPAYPFYHLQREEFWTLVPKPGQEREVREGITSSMTRLRSVLLGAQIEPGLFDLLSDSNRREELRVALVQTYFAPGVRESLLREAAQNEAAYQYSQRLLQAADTVRPYASETEYTPQPVRHQGFRKAVMQLYSHRCALCGIRMITPDGYTIVEAAHIRPWSKKHDDRPANGMALCKLCHWSFDNGFMGVGQEYEVLVSPLTREEQNNPGPIMTLEQRPIFLPEDSRHIPDQNCLEKHRQEVYRT